MLTRAPSVYELVAVLTPAFPAEQGVHAAARGPLLDELPVDIPLDGGGSALRLSRLSFSCWELCLSA